MNRQGFASMRLSTLNVQQGLFASLALVVTLIGGQQWGRWEQMQQPVATSVQHVVTQQQHFGAIRSSLQSSSQTTGRYDLAAAEDTQIAHSQPAPERWVF